MELKICEQCKKQFIVNKDWKNICLNNIKEMNNV